MKKRWLGAALAGVMVLSLAACGGEKAEETKAPETKQEEKEEEETKASGTEAAETKAAYLSPVPGGVGSVTSSVLAKHVIRSADYFAKNACKHCRGVVV